MTAYINTETLEYPRHEGDLALDPNGEYAPVTWVDPPEYDRLTHTAYETPPVLVDGVWMMTWAVRELTDSEIVWRDKPIDLGDVTASGTAPDVAG